MAEAKKICIHGRCSHLPEDIIFHDILSRFPVKTLCRWKCVSKPWRSFIEDPILVYKYRPKKQPLWIRRSQKLPYFFDVNMEDMNIHIYSVNSLSKGATTVVKKYTPPPNPVFLKHYNSGLICCYHGSLQLTVFDAITQESISLTLPVIRERRQRCFEYGFDSLSRKYKVLSYRYGGISICRDPVDEKYVYLSDFKVLTLGEERLTWRPVKTMCGVECLPNWVVTVNGTLFWYQTGQIISFDFATEEFGRIEITECPSKTNYKYFDRPLFEFEGSLCYVEIEEEEIYHLKLNMWMLKDTDVLVPLVKNIMLSLGGTTLRTKDDYVFFDLFCMERMEFSAQNGELLMAVRDSVKQYVFSSSFLSCQCKRITITGHPMQHPTIEKCIRACPMASLSPTL